MRKHRTIKNHLAEFLFHKIANNLPSSLAPRFGRIYKKWRADLARVYCVHVGENVNMEPHVSF